MACGGDDTAGHPLSYHNQSRLKRFPIRFVSCRKTNGPDDPPVGALPGWEGHPAGAGAKRRIVGWVRSCRTKIVKSSKVWLYIQTNHIEWVEMSIARTNFGVAILLALTMPASAQDIHSANTLLPGCKDFVDASTPTVSALKQGLCVAFVRGVLYASSSIVCWPQGVTTSQAVAVVVKYIEARPKMMDEPFGKLALEALTAAWPCKR